MIYRFPNSPVRSSALVLLLLLKNVSLHHSPRLGKHFDCPHGSVSQDLPYVTNIQQYSLSVHRNLVDLSCSESHKAFILEAAWGSPPPHLRKLHEIMPCFCTISGSSEGRMRTWPFIQRLCENTPHCCTASITSNVFLRMGHAFKNSYCQVLVNDGVSPLTHVSWVCHHLFSFCIHTHVVSILFHFLEDENRKKIC